MVALRIYDPQTGLILSDPGAVTITNGAIDCLGNGLFYKVSPTTVDLFAVDGQGVPTLVRSLLTFGGGQVGCGVAIQRNQQGELDPEGHQVWVALSTLPGGALTYTLRLYDMSSASGVFRLLHEVEHVPVTAVGGICTNGDRLWAGISNLSNAPRLLLIDTDGPTLTTVRDFNWGVLITDMTYDGSHLWTIEGTNAVQHSFQAAGGAAVPVVVNTIALAGSTQAGIAFDGQHLFVLSRT